MSDIITGGETERSKIAVDRARDDFVDAWKKAVDRIRQIEHSKSFEWSTTL